MITPATPAGPVGFPRPADATGRQPFGTPVDLARVLDSVRRHVWLILGVVTVGTVLGVAAARRMRPSYAARATLWVDVQDPRLRDQPLGPIQSGQLMGPTGWIDLLRSRVVMDHVVNDLGLYLSLGDRADSSAFADFRLSGPVARGTYVLQVDARGRQFTLSEEGGAVLQRDTVGAAIGAALGWAWQPGAVNLKPSRTMTFRVTPPEAASERLGEEIRVRTDMEGKVGNIIKIEMRGAQPDGIAVVTNAIADRFVSVASELRRDKLTELTRILKAQLDQAQRSLTSSEQALAAFRVANALELARSGAGVARDPAAGSVFQMQDLREQARRDRLAIERLLAESSDGRLSIEGLGMVGAVARSAELSQALAELSRKELELRAMRYRYTEEHLPVQQLARAVEELQRERIPAMANALVTQLFARESELNRQINSAAGALREIPPVAIEEARLQRNLTIAEVLFTNIQQRYQEARIAEVSTLPEVRVLDRAVRPHRPVYNAKSIVVAIAFLSSLGIAVVGAMLLDQVDPRLRDPEEVTRRMGLPILGAVPHAGGNGTREAVATAVDVGSRLLSAVRASRAWRSRALAPGVAIDAEVPESPLPGGAAQAAERAKRFLGTLGAWAEKIAPVSALGRSRPDDRWNQAIEALRGIRLNLAHAYGSTGPLLVTITSPGRGDGKSFVSSNLALAFADAGHRTLLVDGDIRRGALHRVLGVKRQPGLIDFLGGEADRSEIIQETSYARLSFIGCGTRVHHGPELLGSPAMQRLMAELRSAYDVIVVDSPPLAAGIDAFILGTLTGNIALVLRAGVTDRQLAEAKLDALERLPIRLLGAVVNDVPLQGAYRYYSYYLAGYEIEEPAASAPAVPNADVG